MKIVLVTGSNRGIGYEICKQLDENNCQVILCSRDLNKGLKAASLLSKNTTVVQLDITKQKSVEQVYEFVLNQFGRLDVLINNAGVGADRNESELIANVKQIIRKHFHRAYTGLKKAKQCLENTNLINDTNKAQNVSFDAVNKIMETNFYGAWRMINFFIPLLLKSECGKIINISSGMGAFDNLSGLYPGYSLSKSALNALTLMFSNELKSTGVKVNAVCPGWVKTDMGGPDAPLPVSEGADTAVWLTLNDEIPSGKFFKNRQVINW